MQHILLLDDELEIRETLGMVLGDKGYRVTEAGTVAEALAVVRGDPPDLIISDLQLEESDGFEFAEQANQIAPAIPIVLLTGVLFDPAAVQQLSEKKIAAYIAKTAPLAHILQEVSSRLKKK